MGYVVVAMAVATTLAVATTMAVAASLAVASTKSLIKRLASLRVKASWLTKIKKTFLPSYLYSGLQFIHSLQMLNTHNIHCNDGLPFRFMPIHFVTILTFDVNKLHTS